MLEEIEYPLEELNYGYTQDFKDWKKSNDFLNSVDHCYTVGVFGDLSMPGYLPRDLVSYPALESYNHFMVAPVVRCNGALLVAKTYQTSESIDTIIDMIVNNPTFVLYYITEIKDLNLIKIRGNYLPNSDGPLSKYYIKE